MLSPPSKLPARLLSDIGKEPAHIKLIVVHGDIQNTLTSITLS